MTAVEQRVDTVERAMASPGDLQPHAELGLRDDEYERIREILGRRPTQAELAMYSIMWSEHCSYKSSKVHLRQFADKNPRSDRLLAGIGENAGVVRISEHLAVTFKVESHNHPSFVEPYQGAATGIGGIVRDILAMGARPIGVMDPLRFGAADHPDTARVLPGVVAGIGGYGNCLGLPNIGGEVVFDPSYQGNPLVNALCVGVLPVDQLQNKAATGPGNDVILIGAKTGRDGIGGVSVLASATFDDASQQRRPSVQVGDPFTEKLLIEACLELYDAGLIVGIQDLGGAGLTCALTETAAAAGTGMRIELDRVLLREASMEPQEILASESQERMLLIVEPSHVERVLAVCDKWGVLATALGAVTDTGRLVITWHGETVVDVPPGSLADDGPVYARPMREPADVILLQADRAETLPRPRGGDELRATLLRMIASPNLCDRSWVTEQYDRYVLGNTVLAQPEDAGVLRVDEATGLGVAISVDGNGRYTRLDPYAGAQLALAEAYRNVAVTGATPVAVTNCLNFGSPEDPTVMWQFAEAVRGLADGCAVLGVPVTGGNVSFYNSTGAAAIHPTPIVGVLGVLDEVAQRVPMGFSRDGDVIFLLGETHTELSGSEWAWVTHGHLGGLPPRVDLAREQLLASVIAAAARVEHLVAAHDLSDGGLAQALVESCLRRGLGARIALPDGVDPFVYLFSESTGRALAVVPHGNEKAFTGLCDERGLPWTALGVVDASRGALDVRGEFAISLDELRAAWSSTLPRLFDQPSPIPAEDADDVEVPVPAGGDAESQPVVVLDTTMLDTAVLDTAVLDEAELDAAILESASLESATPESASVESAAEAPTVVQPRLVESTASEPVVAEVLEPTRPAEPGLAELGLADPEPDEDEPVTAESVEPPAEPAAPVASDAAEGAAPDGVSPTDEPTAPAGSTTPRAPRKGGTSRGKGGKGSPLT